MPRTPVVLRRTDVKTWLFIHFLEGVTLNKTQLQDIFEGHWSRMNQIWSKYITSQFVCGNAHSPPEHLSKSISRLCGDYKLTKGLIDAQKNDASIVTPNETNERSTVETNRTNTNDGQLHGTCLVSTTKVLGTSYRRCGNRYSFGTRPTRRRLLGPFSLWLV